MIKHYCDKCGEEITKKNEPPHPVCGSRFRFDIDFRREQRGYIARFEVVEGIDEEERAGSQRSCNNAEFCKYCIIGAINRFDDRPKEFELTQAQYKRICEAAGFGSGYTADLQTLIGTIKKNEELARKQVIATA